MSLSNENEKIRKDINGTYAEDVLLVKENSNPSRAERNTYQKYDTPQNNRYCAKCGNIIDNQTKKCRGCGKQYFNIKKVAKLFIPIVVILSLVVSIGMNLWQKKQLANYEEQNNDGEEFGEDILVNPNNVTSYDVSKVIIRAESSAGVGDVFSEMNTNLDYLIHDNAIDDVYEVEYKVIGGVSTVSAKLEKNEQGSYENVGWIYGPVEDWWYKVTLPDGRDGYVWGGTNGMYVDEVKSEDYFVHLDGTVTQGSGEDSNIVSVSEPTSGTVLQGSEYFDGSEITITASDSESCYVKLKTQSGETRLGFYVRAGETVAVGVPSEFLYAYFASGETWGGLEVLFGERTSYSMDDNIIDFTEYTCRYTLYPVNNGNFSQTPIDASEF